MDKIKTYYQLVKPERTLTNVFTAAAGYLYASRWQVDWSVFGGLLAGTTLIIASACVLNNFLDRDMDKKMQRTLKRALVRGEVRTAPVLIYALVLGITGFWLLAYTNWLTFWIGEAAFVGYVILYDLAKRYTVHSTLVGTLPGGASLVAGYTAFAGRLDASAWLLFIIMAAWQMAHFYAIAIYRHDDYVAAGLPVMSVKYGTKITKLQVIIYIFIFALAAALLSVLGLAGMIYRIVAILLGVLWLARSLATYKKLDDKAWAHDVFKTSLVVLLALMSAIAVSTLLP